MNSSEKRPESASGCLAEYLQEHREAIISEWVAQVRKDSDVPTDSLTKPEIVDHVPQIFDATVQALRQQRSDAATEEVQRISTTHTIIRWAQDYDLQGMLREISLLRAELIRHLRAFEEEQRSLGSDAHLHTSTTIHIILDDIVLDATEAFLRLKAQAGGDDA